MPLPSSRVIYEPNTEFLFTSLNLVFGALGVILLVRLVIFLIKGLYFTFSKHHNRTKPNTKARQSFKKFAISIGMLVIALFIWFVLSIALGFSGVRMVSDKPIIYLYPEKTQETLVQLDYKGELIADYPAYNYDIKGWQVIAEPDGKITDPRDDREYSYLFWEGIPHQKQNYDWSQGFVVAGDQTRDFFQQILPQIGLTPTEYNEFIVFWYPRMMNNPYNLIHFAADSEYSDALAPLTIAPAPDNILRVFMVYQSLDRYPQNPPTPQAFPQFSRSGFTVVEWGGSEIL